jgi:hypothetical protein
VEIPGSVANIGRSAFYGCTNLSAIHVDPANSDYTSEDGVLYNKNKTTLLVYPSGKGGVFSIPGSVTNIGDSAFYDCSSLVSVEIPNTVTKIGTSAFRGCSGLTSIEIPGSVTGLGDFVFAYCSGLRHVFVNWATPVPVGGSVFNNGINPQNLTLYVPSGAKAAYQAAPVWKDFGTVMEAGGVPGDSDFEIVNGVLVRYRGAGGQVVIPDEVTGIGNRAFVNCIGLTSVEIPGLVANIGDSAFYGCIGLTSVGIPGPVAGIGKRAFGHCISLASVEIANSVVSIGESAFEDCISLVSVEIPASVAGIGAGAFGGCSSLHAIETDAANGDYLSEDGILYNRDKTELHTFPAGRGGDFSIPASVAGVGAYAFSGCRGLRSVEIPGSVASLGSNAFARCSGLKDVTVAWAVPLLPEADASTGAVSAFEGVPLSACTLHVPVGAKAVYEAADIWKDFGTVAEIAPELTVPAEEIAFAFDGGRDSVTVISNMGWTLVSGGSPRLNVTPASGGFGRDTVRLAAVANTDTSVRRDTLVFAGGGLTRRVAIVQEGLPHISADPSEAEGDSGTIDISLNIPVNETFTVTFTVSLPAGFLLNPEATSLAAELLSRFELEITPNGAGGWSFSIRPRVSTLSGTETAYQQVVQVAFTMDETVEAGEHEAKISDVDLQLNSGQTIHQDEIAVPVTVTNPVGNAVVGSAGIVYAGGLLSVNTPVAERITVYAVSGAAVYRTQKLPGSATLDLNSLPRGMMIVRGDSGWVKKIVR